MKFEINKLYYSYMPGWQMGNMSQGSLKRLALTNRYEFYRQWLKDNFYMTQYKRNGNIVSGEHSHIIHNNEIYRVCVSNNDRYSLAQGQGRFIPSEGKTKYINYINNINGYILFNGSFGHEHIIYFALPSQQIITNNYIDIINKNYIYNFIGADMKDIFSIIKHRYTEAYRIYSFDIPIKNDPQIGKYLLLL